MKKIFAILLACAIIFSTLPVVVFAEAEAHDHAEVDQCHCDRDTRTGTLVRSVEANCTDQPQHSPPRIASRLIATEEPTR